MKIAFGLARIALGLTLAIGTAAALTPAAEARVVVGVGVGLPYYYGPHYYPPPVYYAPPPVYYAPPAPVVVQPSPVMEQGAASRNWYYCDASQAYYPYVTSCSSSWREVAPQAPSR